MAKSVRLSRSTVLAVATAVTSALAGCGDGKSSAQRGASASPSGAARSPSASPSVSPSASLAPAPALALSKRVPRTAVADGVFVASCEGDAPLLCFTSGATAATVELVTFPRASIDRLRSDASPAAMRAWAGDYLRSFADDRRAGCPRGYTYAPLPVDDVRVFGRPGLRYGFVVADTAGRPVERTIGFATATATDLQIATTSSYDKGSCLDPEGVTTTPAQLEALQPVLTAVLANAQR